MAAPERLRVSAVGERHLDPDEHVAGARLRVRNLLDPQVSRPVVEERPYGLNTTFTASWDA